MRRVLLVLAILLAASPGWAAKKRAAPVPAAPGAAYAGEVQAITAPLLLRYRPFRASYVESLTVTATGYPGSLHDQTRDSGTMIGEPVAGYLAITMTPAAANRRPLSRFDDGDLKTLRLLVTDRGQVRDVAAALTTGETGGIESAPFVEWLQANFGEMLPLLPSAGIRSGDRLYDEQTELGELFDEAPQLPVHAVGRVKGRTSYQGRDSVLVEYTGGGSGSGVSVQIAGYELIDVKTGLVSRSEKSALIRQSGTRSSLRATTSYQLRFL
jgi:hypothetical protein